MTEVLERPVDYSTAEHIAQTLHERYFGNQEITHLPLDSLIMLSQIRGEENPILDDLKESIDQEDLDNPINVARVTEEELNAYVQYTNRLWGAQVTVSEFSYLVQPDGRYNLVVGGHSRTISIQQLAREHTERTGEGTDWHVQAKLLQDTSVRGIAKKQLAENLHKGAPIEREAMAVVEFYDIGLGIDWHDLKSFQKAMAGKLKKSTINAAVAFHSLPVPVRVQIFKKEMPFIAGVALGKGADTIRDYMLTTAGYKTEDKLDTEAEELVTAAVEDKLCEYASHITNDELSPSKARFYILSKLKSLHAKAEKIKAAREKDANAIIDDSLFGDDEFTMADPKEELRKLQRKVRAERMRRLREIDHHNNQRTTEIILSMSPVDDREAHVKLLTDVETSKVLLETELQRRVGSCAIEEPDGIFDLDEDTPVAI